METTVGGLEIQGSEWPGLGLKTQDMILMVEPHFPQVSPKETSSRKWRARSGQVE